jgi:hypothetical protein
MSAGVRPARLPPRPRRRRSRRPSPLPSRRPPPRGPQALPIRAADSQGTLRCRPFTDHRVPAPRRSVLGEELDGPGESGTPASGSAPRSRPSPGPRHHRLDHDRPRVAPLVTGCTVQPNRTPCSTAFCWTSAREAGRRAGWMLGCVRGTRGGRWA